MISQADEKLIEEISLLLPQEACRRTVRELWKDTNIELSLRLMELFRQKRVAVKVTRNYLNYPLVCMKFIKPITIFLLFILPSKL